jgi:FHS family L-fucose permease-like MFS transporter
MAIIGGAVLTAAMGLISDLSGAIRMAMLVPSAAFLVVAGFAWNRRASLESMAA